MPGRLTDTITELVGADQLEGLSEALGGTQSATSHALRDATNALIVGLADIALPAGGTTRVSEMLDREGIAALERLDEMIERGEDVNGGQLAREILGDSEQAVASSIDATPGLDGERAGARALGFAAPLVVSTLARHQRDENLSGAGIGALVIAERDHVVATRSVSSDLQQPSPSAEAQLASKALEATREETALHEAEERRRRKYAWPFILVFAIAGVTIAIVLALTLGGDGGTSAPEETTASEPVAPDPPPPEPPAEPELPPDVLAVASADGDFATFLGALSVAGLDDELSGVGPLTLLAPTDAAFDALEAGVVDGLLEDPERLEELLTAHVLGGAHTRAALGQRSDVPTQDGRRLDIENVDGNVVVGGTTIVKPDQRAQNGILQGVDAIIVPDGFELTPSSPNTVIDIAADAGSLTTLLAALDAANLTETLSGEGPFTLFAPTDEAFAALPEGALEAALADPAALEQLLTAHVMGGVQRSDQLAEREDIATITGQVLTITADDTGLTVGGARVTSADAEADNGIVHIVDSVIFPEGLALGSQETAIDVLETAGEFEALLTALERTGQTDELRGPGPLTVFAPTDAAFAALPESVLASAEDTAALAGILSAHYASGAFDAASVAEAQSVLMASGEEIAVVSDGDLVWVGGALVVESLDSGNAAIHVIDRVIIPPALDALDGTVNELLALGPIPFQVGSDTLTPAGERALSRTAAYLRTSPVSIEIGGHTDSDGDEQDNLELSEARAQSVFDFFVAEGVDSAQLTTVGYGETQPVATNETQRGKARNRRIEFIVLS